MSDITVAASEDAVKGLFAVARDNFSLTASDDVDFGPFSAGYDVALHLEGGDVELRADNTVSVEELDIKWDSLGVSVGLDIPEVCVGGWCAIPTPFGCALRMPRKCLFSHDPDIEIGLDLGGLLSSEVSFTASPVTRYFVDPNRPPGMSAIQAQDADMANLWQVLIDPETVDLDPFDVADIVGDLLENAVTAAIHALIPGPSWFRDIVLAILGPIIDLVRALLDLPDDIAEWFSDLLNTSFGLLNIVATGIADHFASDEPIVEIEDPFPILPATAGLIPVKVPIADFDVSINDDEMVVRADVGP